MMENDAMMENCWPYIFMLVAMNLILMIDITTMIILELFQIGTYNID